MHFSSILVPYQLPPIWRLSQAVPFSIITASQLPSPLLLLDYHHHLHQPHFSIIFTFISASPFSLSVREISIIIITSSSPLRAVLCQVTTIIFSAQQLNPSRLFSLSFGSPFQHPQACCLAVAVHARSSPALSSSCLAFAKTGTTTSLPSVLACSSCPCCCRPCSCCEGRFLREPGAETLLLCSTVLLTDRFCFGLMQFAPSRSSAFPSDRHHPQPSFPHLFCKLQAQVSWGVLFQCCLACNH